MFLSVSRSKITCNQCGSEESVEAAVLRGVDEMRILFPGIKITTNLVHEWCGVIGPKKKIRKILLKKFVLLGHGKYSYFV